jgi:hypothetical protein
MILIEGSYRLTVFGYMGSSELLEENGVSNGGNYGLFFCPLTHFELELTTMQDSETRYLQNNFSFIQRSGY